MGDRNPVYCAVDLVDREDARTLVQAIAPHVGGIKLGLEFWNANGADGVRAVADAVPDLGLFLDLKLHDIPNTVAGAIRALEDVPFDLLTVHAAGGETMMRAAKEAAPAEAQVVGVTVLTSLGHDDLEAAGIGDGAAAQVGRLARLAQQAGLDGIVCSPLEVAERHADWAEGTLVVPGIRPAGSAIGDQKRVMTPREALDAGASILVIGRPITSAGDPARAAADISQSLA